MHGSIKRDRLLYLPLGQPLQEPGKVIEQGSHLVLERYAVKMPLGRLFLRTSTVNKSEYDNANYTGRTLKTKYISSVHLFYSPYVS